jgi:hypothetical protein
MSTAMAHIKLQVWEWIPDQRATACRVYVYDPETVTPVYWGWTGVDGYLAFDVEPGMYVIWVWGHNPIGYRPFLSDTWIPVAVLPGETKEVCAALVSIIDIPDLYRAAQTGTHWEPKTFGQLLEEHAKAVQNECNVTAAAQREATREAFGDLKQGVIQRIDKPIDVRRALLERRYEWAKQVAEVNPKAEAEAQEIVKAMERRTRAPLEDEQCCQETDYEFAEDFSGLGPGPVVPGAVLNDVEFTPIWDRIVVEGTSLRCYGSEEVAGTWHDATVRLEFKMLPCRVYKIVADVDGHGPEARMVGRQGDRTTQTAVCPGDRRLLVLYANPDNPFVRVELSGQEAEWFSIRLS